MPFDEAVAERVRRLLKGRRGIMERKMFGGLAFMLGKRMFCGVLKDNVVLRINPADHEKALRKPHIRPMDFTGRPMRGFLYLGPARRLSDPIIARWLKQSLIYAKTLPR